MCLMPVARANGNLFGGWDRYKVVKIVKLSVDVGQLVDQVALLSSRHTTEDGNRGKEDKKEGHKKERKKKPRGQGPWRFLFRWGRRESAGNRRESRQIPSERKGRLPRCGFWFCELRHAGMDISWNFRLLQSPWLSRAFRGLGEKNDRVA